MKKHSANWILSRVEREILGGGGEGAARGGAKQRGEKVKQRKRRGKVKLERVEMNIII